MGIKEDWDSDPGTVIVAFIVIAIIVGGLWSLL